MKLQSRALLLTGALLAAGLGALTPASSAATATTATPTMITSNFVCSNGVCAIGPGDVSMPFEAELSATGGMGGGAECNPYTMVVKSGNLPPGLQLGEPICEWVISGTPTQAGSYDFTVQITPEPNNLGQVGPAGTQQLSITIGAGTADRLILIGAVWSPHSVNQFLQVRGFDVNSGATYTVYVTATGAELETITERTPDNGGDGSFNGEFRTNTDPKNLTVRDSLGGSATIPVTVNDKYSGLLVRRTSHEVDTP